MHLARRLSHANLVMTFLVVGLLLGSTTRASATNKDNPPPLSGWARTSAFSPDDSPQRHGVILPNGAPIIRSSPVIAEIDGDAGNGKEVAVAGDNNTLNNGWLYVYRSDGTLFWQQPLLASNCAFPGDSVANSGPAVGDIDADGLPEVVVGYGTIGASNCDGGVVAFEHNGALKWRFSLRAWQASQGYPPEGLYGVVSTPALADVDGDGNMEVGFGGLDRNLYLLNSQGSVRFYYHAADTIWSSPAFVNVDGDPQLEIVIGTDISANPALDPPTLNGGYVYAFDTHARNPIRLEFRTGYLWQTYLDQAIFSSPVIGDVLPTNPGLEAVVGSSCYFPSPVGHWLKILRLSDGTVLQTLNAARCIQSSPALGDIDNDGALEIVATVRGDGAFPNGNGKVQAWDPTNATPKWTAVPMDANSGANDPALDDLSSPSIADLDGNGSLEILVANVWSVVVLNGNGQQMSCDGPGCGAATSLFAWFTVKSTPAIGDVDGDGSLEVVIGGGHIFSQGNPPPATFTIGLLYAWTFKNYTPTWRPGTTLTTSQPAFSQPWPMFRGKPARTGVFSMPTLSASPNPLAYFQSTGAGGTLQTTLQVLNIGGGTLNWSATSTGGIILNPASGATTSQSNVTVEVVVPPVANGVYDLGTITLSSSNAVNSPLTIPVKRYVGPLVFLPLIRR